MDFSIAGGWLGTYYYDIGIEPARFEANFDTFGWEGGFRGRILDDGPLGEANVEGTQNALSITFVKVYIAPPEGYRTSPVHYQGTMTEDGKRITGRWEIRRGGSGQRSQAVMTGAWEARRLWFENEESSARIESEGLLVGAR